jgi:quinol monooxygenase YgiN
MLMAVVETVLPRDNEAATIGALRSCWDSTCALPGCLRGGVFQEVGGHETALYVEMWQEATPLEAHVRSREYHRLLAIIETAPERPALRFNFVAETRGLDWVEQLRLGSTGSGEVPR